MKSNGMENINRPDVGGTMDTRGGAIDVELHIQQNQRQYHIFHWVIVNSIVVLGMNGDGFKCTDSPQEIHVVYHAL